MADDRDACDTSTIQPVEVLVARIPKRPNGQLAELLEEAGLPAKGLARRVVARAGEQGLFLGYDHNSVRRWLDGEQPQAPAPRLIAEVLSEALGRRIRPPEAGFAADSADSALEFGLNWSDAITAASGLYRSDAERRRTLVGASFSAAAYPATVTRWLTTPDSDVPAHRGRTRVGRPEIQAIRQMTQAFRDLDNRVGGGRIRSTVAQYLDANVAPLLRGSYTEEIGKELFSAVAELMKNVGWMAFDSETHGIAQRYLVQALRMAHTAADRALCAEILAAMGQQAAYIGRDGDAVDLARGARVAAKSAGHPALLAECHLIEAQGHAGRQDRRATAAALSAGEHAFDAADPDPPEWLAYFDSAYLSARIAHCFKALGSDGQTAHYAELSLQMDQSFVRGRAFNLLILAYAHAPNEPVEAARVASQAADLIEGLESKRALSYLCDVGHRLRQHADVPAVIAFSQRMRDVTAS